MRNFNPAILPLAVSVFLLAAIHAEARTIFFGFGETFTLVAADFDAAPKFSDNSKAVAEYNDPVTGKPCSAVLRVEQAGDSGITLKWDKAVKLYSQKSLKGKLASSELQTGFGSPGDLQIASLSLDGSPCNAELFLCNPYVRNLAPQQDGRYAVDGILFGDRKPKVQMEFTSSGKGKENVPGYRNCKVQDFICTQSEGGNATQSFSFTLPDLKPGETATGYFIFSNRIGIEARKADPSSEELTAEFNSAVEDASTREFSEISRNLKSLTPDSSDPELVWDGQGKRVKVIVWTGDYWKDVKPGDIITNFSPADEASLGYFMYVAPYGEVVDYMLEQKFPLDKEMNNRLKLAQRLGLQVADATTDKKKRFLILWAPPASLFRPAPDAEVDDFEAQLARSYGQVETANHWITDHYDWKIENSYDIASGSAYPFTGFGYTYDWSGTASETGFSEFVILPEHEIEVIDNVLTVDFFDSLDN